MGCIPVGPQKKDPWFVGELHRAKATEILMQAGNEPGSFLIRKSSSFPGEYCLSVRSNEDTVRNYRIQSSSNRFFIEESTVFSSLEDLIKYYSTQARGLCMKLKRPFDSTKAHPNSPVWIDDKTTEIDRKSIKLGKKLDEGYFGEVFEGVWHVRQGRIPVAVKKLRKGSMAVNAFQEEARLLKNMEHTNLIVLYGVCMKEEPFYIVTELMKNGSLLKYMQGKGRGLQTEKLVNIGNQVASGMAYLETQNCIHRDLAARNVLVGDDNNFLIKIADFGMARWMKEPQYITSKDAVFPIKWTAPEAVNWQRFSIKSDVWSFGILLMEIFTYGKVPYPGMSNAEALQKVDQGYRMPCPKNCPGSVYDLMISCWDEEANRRPAFSVLQALLRKAKLTDNGPETTNFKRHAFKMASAVHTNAWDDNAW